MYEISESKLKLMIEMFKLDGMYEQKNFLEKLLNMGEEFKEHNLNPIYIFNPRSQNFFVTSRENLERKLH
jgi:hypothetical protein